MSDKPDTDIYWTWGMLLKRFPGFASSFVEPGNVNQFLVDELARAGALRRVLAIGVRIYKMQRVQECHATELLKRSGG